VALHSSLNEASKLAVAAVFKVGVPAVSPRRRATALPVLRRRACLGQVLGREAAVSAEPR
jgi:hypothetical protein